MAEYIIPGVNNGSSITDPTITKVFLSIDSDLINGSGIDMEVSIEFTVSGDVQESLFSTPLMNFTYTDKPTLFTFASSEMDTLYKVT